MGNNNNPFGGYVTKSKGTCKFVDRSLNAEQNTDSYKLTTCLNQCKKSGGGFNSRGQSQRGFSQRGGQSQRGFSQRGFSQRGGQSQRGFSQRGGQSQRGFSQRGFRGNGGFQE